MYVASFVHYFLILLVAIIAGRISIVIKWLAVNWGNIYRQPHHLLLLNILNPVRLLWNQVNLPDTAGYVLSHSAAHKTSSLNARPMAVHFTSRQRMREVLRVGIDFFQKEGMVNIKHSGQFEL